MKVTRHLPSPRHAIPDLKNLTTLLIKILHDPKNDPKKLTAAHRDELRKHLPYVPLVMKKAGLEIRSVKKACAVAWPEIKGWGKAEAKKILQFLTLARETRVLHRQLIDTSEPAEVPAMQYAAREKPKVKVILSPT